MSRLTDLLEQAGVTGLGAQLFEAVARHRDGILMGPAAITLAREIGKPAAECHGGLMELTAAGLLKIRDDASGNRLLLADIEALGGGAAGLEALVVAAPQFEVLGLRQSPPVLERLAKDFQDETDPVYLSFDLASPEEFPGLFERAAHGREVVVFMPRRKDVKKTSAETPALYKDTFEQWRRKIKETAAVREHVELRLMRRGAKLVLWSTLTSPRAFVNLVTDDPASGPGYVLEAKRGTSVYTLLDAEYGRQLAQSDPYWRLSIGGWTKSRLTDPWVALVPVLALAVVLSGASLTSVVLALVLGVGASRTWHSGLAVNSSVIWRRWARRTPP